MYSRANQVILIAVYILFLLAPLIIINNDFQTLGDNPIIVLGRVLGFLGLGIITLQVIIGSRFRIADMAFGLDNILKFHKVMAIVGLCCVIAHPIAISVAYSDFSLLGLNTSFEIAFGKIALLFMILSIIFALVYKTFKLDYNKWHYLHKFTYVVAILALVHFLVISSHYESSRNVQLYAIIIGVIIWINFFRRNITTNLTVRSKTKITDVILETHDTVTIKFDSSKLRQSQFLPGQFMFLKIKGDKVSFEEHPFSISSSPFDNHIAVTVKNIGNYTETIKNVKLGETALIEMPYGRFTFYLQNPEKIVFIAGGVGLTPIMSMLRTMKIKKDKRKVWLFYSVKEKRDILFFDELNKMPKNIHITYLMTREKDPEIGVNSRISWGIIKSETKGEIVNSEIYMCAPKPMMKACEDILKQNNIKSSKIHTEKFSF